ncbi:hypothetical protein BD779DRAFT_1671507 [Infundibulicybe gibba]|nr:hypothetical protein BD779DRAFT_1671507 [Infundibulicybe gibba]
MSTSPGIDYAKLLGIESVVAAAVLAVCYGFLLFWFLDLFFWTRPFNTVFGLLLLFNAVRVTAFIIRTVVAKSNSAGHHLGLVVGDEILFDVGFAVLLYSTYVLSLRVLAIEGSGIFINANIIDVPLVVIRGLFEFAMIAAVALSIIGVIQSHSTNPHTVDLGRNLQKASTIIFLVFAVLQAYLTLRLLWALTSPRVGVVEGDRGPQGMEYYGYYIRCAISLLLLMREAFATATRNDTAKFNNENFWYPLIALPEILAVMLHAIPLVGAPPTAATTRYYSDGYRARVNGLESSDFTMRVVRVLN